MIGNAVRELLLENEENFLISGENVAHVMEENPLNHALLVLTKVGYSKIPVLNKEDKMVGLISLSAIVDAMFDVTEVDPTNLNALKVKDVMETDITTLRSPFEIEDILHLLVEHPFLPVVDDKKCFMGIVTRKEILKAVNHMAHELELDYDVSKKNGLLLENRKIG